MQFSWQFKPKHMGGGWQGDVIKIHMGHAKIQMIGRDLDFGKTKQFSSQHGLA